MIDLNDDPEMLAAEYVLGVLDRDDMATISNQLASNASLAEAVTGWEKRLSPLAWQIDPVPVPAQLWPRIAASLGRAGAGTVVSLPAPEIARALTFWRAATAAGIALAAGFAALLLARPTLVAPPTAQPAPYVTALTPRQNNGPSWAVRAGADGKIIVTSIGPVSKAADRDLQLWAVAPGAAKPVSLGVLPQSGTYVTSDAGLPHAHLLLLVSLEPKGGSPTGLPTGPVLFGGELTQSVDTR